MKVGTMADKNASTDTESLAAYVTAMTSTRILVIGDICLDRFVRGDVGRISSEGPIPVMVTRQEHRMLGQAGNTFANLCGLGVKASILSVIGSDREGEIITALVTAAGADIDGLIVNEQTPTTVKTRYMSGHQQVFRVDTEGVGGCPAVVENILLARIAELVPKQDAIILSDYGYHLLSDKIIRQTIEMAQAKNIPILVDPRGHDLSKYKGATVATPNRKELGEATGGMPTITDQNIVDAAYHLMSQSGITSIVATRSADGMSIIDAHSPPTHLRTTAKEVFDVSGAGDTVIATIAAGLAAGAPLTSAASLANIAGGIVVGKVGTAIIRAHEILDALTHPDSISSLPLVDRGHAPRIVDWDTALENIERWQARGHKIGFTNGCFDILHAGHVNYLNAARAECDRLILAINTDASVRILKGPTRPINNQESRATVMAGLGAIDLVVFFGAEKEGDDNTAKAVIEHLKPDIYFKGGDYTIENLPEAPVVHAYGGKIRLMTVTEGHSTTGIIAKIGDKNAGKAA